MVIKFNQRKSPSIDSLNPITQILLYKVAEENPKMRKGFKNLKLYKSTYEFTLKLFDGDKLSNYNFEQDIRCYYDKAYEGEERHILDQMHILYSMFNVLPAEKQWVAMENLWLLVYALLCT